MSRVVPASAVSDLYGSETEGFHLVFLIIDHPDLGGPLRLVSDGRDFVLGGETHVGFPFRITLMSDTNRAPEARLTIQNVDRRIVKLIRRITDPPKLSFDVIWSDQFDLTVNPRTEIGTAAKMYSARECYLTNIEADVEMVSGVIRSWDFSQELWPGTMAVKDVFPGLFR